jgi:hypothetical protein
MLNQCRLILPLSLSLLSLMESTNLLKSLIMLQSLQMPSLFNRHLPLSS